MKKSMEKTINVGCNWYSKKEIEKVYVDLGFRNRHNFIFEFKYRFNKRIEDFADFLCISKDNLLDLLKL